MVIASTNTGSGFIGGAVDLGIPHLRGPGQPPVVPNILPPLMTGRLPGIVRILAGLGATAAIIQAWSRIVAEPVPDLDDVARDLREAMEEAQRIFRKGAKRLPYGKTSKPTPPRRPIPGGPQTLYVGPDIFKKIGTDVAEQPGTKELPDPEQNTERRTRRKKKKERIRVWFERRYSVAWDSKNKWMLLPKQLE